MSQGDEGGGGGGGTVSHVASPFSWKSSVARTKYFPRYMLHDAESQLDLCVMNRRKS